MTGLTNKPWSWGTGGLGWIPLGDIASVWGETKTSKIQNFSNCDIYYQAKLKAFKR